MHLWTIVIGYCWRWYGSISRDFCKNIQEWRATEGIGAHHNVMCSRSHDWKLESSCTACLHLLPYFLFST